MFQIMTEACGVQPPQNVVIAMAGMAKMFAGDVLETALDVRDEQDKSDRPAPLTPHHLRLALLRMQGDAMRAFPLPASTRPNPFL